MEQNKLQTPQQILSEFSVRHTVEKAEQERLKEIDLWKEKGFSSPEAYSRFLNEKDIQNTRNGEAVKAITAKLQQEKHENFENEINTWEEKGFKSKNDYANNLLANERKARKQAKMAEIINSNNKSKNKKAKIKKALALVAVGGVAGAFGMWYMMKHKDKNEVAGFVMPIDPYQPVGDIDPTVWESIVSNPEYKQQVEQIIKETQDSLASVQSGTKSQISSIISDMNSQFSVSRELEKELCGGYYGNINGYVRKDGEGCIEFYQRIKYEAMQDLPERQQNFLDDVARVYPEKKEYFIANGKEWNFDNFWAYYDYEFSFSEHVEKYPECYRKNEDGSYTQIKDIPLPEGFTKEFIEGVPSGYNTMDVADTWDELYSSLSAIEDVDKLMENYAKTLSEDRQQEFYDYITELQNAYASADTQTDNILNNFTSQITDLQNSFANETQNYIGDCLGAAIIPTPQDQTLDVDLNSVKNVDTSSIGDYIDYSNFTPANVSSQITSDTIFGLDTELTTRIAVYGTCAAALLGAGAKIIHDVRKHKCKNQDEEKNETELSI